MTNTGPVGSWGRATGYEPLANLAIRSVARSARSLAVGGNGHVGPMGNLLIFARVVGTIIPNDIKGKFASYDLYRPCS